LLQKNPRRLLRVSLTQIFPLALPLCRKRWREVHWQIEGSRAIPQAREPFAVSHRQRQLLFNRPLGSGWKLDSAAAINNLGQIIGDGVFQGEFRSYILNPVVVPVPAAIWLFGSGLLGLVASRGAAAPNQSLQLQIR
jgi:hypothetical protein